MNKYLVSLLGLFWLTSVSVHAQDTSIMMTYYGTANDAARAKTMEPLNAKVSQTFPKSIIAEAYTSDMVVRALRKRGIEKYTVGEAFANLRQAKSPVLVVNVQLLDGIMTDKLQADISSTGVSADSLRYTSPLLYNSDDARWLARMLAKHIKADSDEEVVLVGHGTNDSANAMYALIDYVMQHEVDERYHVGTIENYPDMDMIKKILHAKQARKVVLYPLLLIAGNHALEDIQGDWKDKLEKAGYSVRVIREGLLEIPEVQQRIIDKISNKVY